MEETNQPVLSQSDILVEEEDHPLDDVEFVESEGAAGSPQTLKASWSVSVAALIRKNILLVWTSKISLLVMLLFPAMAVGISTYLDTLSSTNYSNYYEQAVIDSLAIETLDNGDPLEGCQWFDVYGEMTRTYTSDCITLLFTVSGLNNGNDVDSINKIMASIADESDLNYSPIVLDSLFIPQPPFQQQILGVRSLDDIGEFLVQHPGRAAGIVVFQEAKGTDFLVDIWYNVTENLGNNRPETQERLRAALGRGVLKAILGKTAVDVVIRTRSFLSDVVVAEVNTKQNNTNYSEVGIGAYFMGFSLALAYILASIVLSTYLAREKQEGLIGSLRVVGMTDSAYWASWFFIGTTFDVLSSFLAMALAYTIDAPVLTQSDFFTPWIFLIFAGMSMYAFVTLTVGIVTQRRAVYGLQFVVMILVLVSSSYGASSSGKTYDIAGFVFRAFIPGFLIESVSLRVATYSSLASANENVTLTYTFATLFDRIGDCNVTILQEEARCEYVKLFDSSACWKYDDCEMNDLAQNGNYNCAPEHCYYFPVSGAFSLLIMALQTALFVFLTWYFFKVIPSGNGIHRKPWFLASHRYWRPRSVVSNTAIAAEQQISKKEQSIRICGICKLFGGFKALDEVNLEMANGQVFVMLGHNGAGKTTLINLLTGKISPSSGDAYVLGHSVVNDVESIQKLVGSVPQHDLLWSELSAYEHIRLFATIKGIVQARGRNSRENAISSILEKVHLEKEAKQSVGGYSGGMKRRLSIALAGVGSPAILFMDEPTTGIDPLNRRRIWKLIQDLKKGRVIVITTHLMQEADSLGDYVAILDHGRVQAKGTPLNLKTEHGSGYTLNIVTDVENVDRVCALAKQAIPTVELVNNAAGSVAIGIPQNGLEKVPQLARDLEEENIIREWGVSQSTLEEVFLRLVKRDSASNAATVTSLTSNRVRSEREPGQSNFVVGAMDPPLEEGDMEATFATKHIWILQVRSLMWKALLLQRRSIVSTCVFFAIPVGLLLLLYFVAFKDLKVNNENEILIYPQAIASIDVDYCTFHWLVSSAMSAAPDPMWYHSTPIGIATAFQVGQQPPGSYDHLSLIWSLSIASNVTVSQVEDAIQFAFRNELKRALNSVDQGIADAECKGDVCGPCFVDPIALTVTMEDNDFLFSLPGSFGIRLPLCPLSGSYDACPLNVVRFVVLQASFATTVAEQLGTLVSLITGPSYVYPNSFQSIPKVNTVTKYDSCLSCEDHILLWLSGNGAGSFAELVNKDGTEAVVTELDVLAVVQANRQELEKRNEDLDNMTYSACAYLQDQYDYNGVERGWIMNKEVPAVLPTSWNSSDICDIAEEARKAYQSLFPDAALQVSSFDVLGDQVAVNMVVVMFETSYYPTMGVYNLKDQAVFSVYCNEYDADQNGTCFPNASLSCSMIVPPASQGCSIPDEGRSLLIESTYNLLLNAAQGGTLRVNEKAKSLYNTLRYEPALSLQELALMACFYALFVAMLMPTTSSTIVLEKHQRYVFSMLLNGLSLRNYWIATYVFHAIMSLMVVAFSIVFGVVLRLKPLENLSYAYLTLIVITYIHAQFGFVALFSIFFSKERLSAIVLSLGSIILFCTAYILLAVVTSILSQWPGALSLVPMLGASRAIFLLLWKRNFDEVLSIAGILFGSGTLYLMIGIYVHGATGVGALWKPNCSSKVTGGTKKDEGQIETLNEEDDEESHDFDIRHEAIRALALSPDETAIKMAHLGKVFPAHPNPKYAVVDLSMAIDYGEIFGLLGPNGAGKTTVISMLVGQLDPSQGAAYVGGFHTVEQRKQALNELGIVPQFDVLYPELSVKEHLQMYAAVKGVVRQENLMWATHIANKVSLAGELFNKPCKNLSGGMKRRLSIAIALLSNPKILFLDEPTTGLDPDMKRSIWEIVEHMRHGRCIILTTHAMDEAETLCNRIGIMANGSLKCIGTPAHLRKRYGSTFELTFTIAPSADGDGNLDGFLKEFSETATCVSAFGQTRVYTMDKDQMDLASLFTMILKGQAEGLYSEWGISNTSLDEVFCAITAESEGAQANEF